MAKSRQQDAGLADRMSGDGDVFEPTAEGLLRWARSTRPAPSTADVARAAADLPDAEKRKLRRSGIQA